MNRLRQNSYEWEQEYKGAIKFMALFGLLEQKERNTLAPQYHHQETLLQKISRWIQ